MKIALLAPAVSPHAVKWANMFQKRGNSVTVFSLPEDKPDDLLYDAGISVNYLDVKAADDGLRANAKNLKHMISAGDFDVVNAFGANTYGVLAMNAKQKYLLTITGLDMYAAEGADKAICSKVIKKAAAVCCPTNAAMQKAMALIKNKPKEYFVVTPGIDLYKFDIKEGMREEGVVTFGCIKALEELSGIDVLLDAYKEMKGQTEAKTRLIIIGEGSKENELRHQAAKLGIESEVEFKGYVPNDKLPDEINRMNALVNPSRYEMLGVSTLEGMACGVPTIATDTDGSSEIILNGVTGYTVKNGNLSALVYRLKEFAEYPQNAAKMGTKTRGDIEDYYEINACTEKYMKALEFASKK